MATLKKLIQSAPRMRGSLPKKAQTGAVVDKTSTGLKRNVAKDIKAERTTVVNKNKAIVNKYSKEAKKLRDSAGTLFTMEAMNDLPSNKKDYSGVMALNKAAKTQDSLATVAKKNPKYKPALKNGGSIKAKNGIKCWTGYKKQGTKTKGGKTVNNCVKK